MLRNGCYCFLPYVFFLCAFFCVSGLNGHPNEIGDTKEDIKEILIRLNRLETEIDRLQIDDPKKKMGNVKIDTVGGVNQPFTVSVKDTTHSLLSPLTALNVSHGHKKASIHKRSEGSSKKYSVNESHENSWSKLQISPDEFGSMHYDHFAIAIYAHAKNNYMRSNNTKRYFYAPNVALDHASAISRYNNSTQRAEMRFRVRMWDHRLETAVKDYISRRELYSVSPEQIGILPFDKVMLVSTEISHAKYRLPRVWQDYQRHQFVSFTVVCDQSEDCQQLVENMKSHPEDFYHLKILFSMASQRSEDRETIIKLDNIFEGGLMAKIIQQFPNEKEFFVSATDEARLVQETANKVIIDMYDESSIISSHSEAFIYRTLQDMLIASRQTVTTSSTKIWESVFWDKDNYRPDRSAKTFNEVYDKLNEEQRKTLSESFSRVNKMGFEVSSSALSASARPSFDFSRAGNKSGENLKILFQETKNTVGWDGERFIPKALNLSRVNIGELRNKQSFSERKVKISFTTSLLSLPINYEDYTNNKTHGNDPDGSLILLQKTFREELSALKETMDAINKGLKAELKNKVDLPKQSSYQEMAQSCNDLYDRGQRFSGMEIVHNGSKYELVHCDFTKSSSQQGFETRIGFVDVKSSPVYFYVQRNSNYVESDPIIKFELERVNLGGAMNLETGIFTAPRNGVYFFAYAAVDSYSSSAETHIQLNGIKVGAAYSSQSSFATSSLSSTLKLKAGDQVSMHLSSGFIFDNTNHFTHFTGFLVEEDF